MNNIAKSSDSFNVLTHCAHCQKRTNVVGAVSMFIPKNRPTEPVTYFVCGKCSKRITSAKPSRFKKFAQRCEDNLILAATEVKE